MVLALPPGITLRKEPYELSVGEAALLAVVLPSPGRNPRPGVLRTLRGEAQGMLQWLYEARVINERTYQQVFLAPTLFPPVHHRAGLYGGRMHGPVLRHVLSEKHVQTTLRALLHEKP
jgi:hypothetical protein